MAYHFIAITSQYQKGFRVGWHYSSEGQLDATLIRTFLRKVREKCGEIELGIHKLSTDSTDLKSVINKDRFFKDVLFTEDMDDFIDFVASDQKLTALDISKFLLTILPSSHLKLQKLLYFCYAEFLMRTGKKLFEEPIVAYKYGPVVEGVFQRFKHYGSSVIDYKEDETFIIKPNVRAATPSFIKVITSKHGPEAMMCIIDVLKKYGKEKPFDLVERTHKKGGPWDRVYKEGENRVITDSIIKQYHYVVE